MQPRCLLTEPANWRSRPISDIRCIELSTTKQTCKLRQLDYLTVTRFEATLKPARAADGRLW